VLAALTPLVKVAGRRRKWLLHVSLYTAAGTLTSAMVGAAAGAAGQVGIPNELATASLAAAVGIAVVAIARELRWPQARVPQVRRQTNDAWAKLHGMTIGSVMWGLDLGLVFSTYVAFSGAWVLLAVALAIGQPLAGAAVFASYWAGRALSVWIAPWLVQAEPALLMSLTQEVDRQRRTLRAFHVVGLCLVIVTAGIWLRTGVTP
jgi:hypothetical protein